MSSAPPQNDSNSNKESESEVMESISNLLDRIMSLSLGKTDTIQLTDNRFLFVENWKDKDGRFTSLELNSGYVSEDDTIVLTEVLECGTYNFHDRKDIRTGIEYILNCIN